MNEEQARAHTQQWGVQPDAEHRAFSSAVTRHEAYFDNEATMQAWVDGEYSVEDLAGVRYSYLHTYIDYLEQESNAPPNAGNERWR